MRPRLYSPNFLRCVRRTTLAPVNWLARIATQLRSARLHVAPGALNGPATAYARCLVLVRTLSSAN